MSTQTATARTATLAVLAIAQHAATHLLVLNGIDTPIHAGDPVTIRIRAGHLAIWLDSLDDCSPVETRRSTAEPDWETVSCRARVPSPIGDVAVVLVSARRIEHGMRVVAGGVA